MSSEAEAFMDAVVAYIAEGHALLAADRTEDIKSLGMTAERLNTKAQQLAPLLLTQHAERYARLCGELEALAKALETRRGAVVDEMRGMEQVRKAGIAYRTVQANKQMND